jgi:recombination protein RecT
MNAVVKTNEQKPAAVFRAQLEQRIGSFAEALPPHITPELFKSVVARAVMADPALLAADRISLFESCLAAAQDGLLPDKREGALVIYNTKIKENGRDVWIKKVQWLPMVRGIITKIYNTGKVKSVSLDIVYGGDEFRYWTDDQGEHLVHIPAEDRNKDEMRRVYALVVMKDGGVFAEPLDFQEVDKVRKSSRTSERGPWADWYEEMAKKTAIKRLAKRLPISREIQQVLDRDNYLYDIENRGPETRPRRGSLTQQLDELAGGGHAQIEDQTSTSNFAPMPDDVDQRDAAPASREQAPEENPSRSRSSGAKQSDDPTPDEAHADGAAARDAGKSRKAVPQRFKGNDRLLEAWLAGFDGDVDESEPGEEG